MDLIKAKGFGKFIDKILVDKQNEVGPETNVFADDGIINLVLDLAGLDFSNHSRIKETLKEELLKSLEKDSEELDDADLDHVAAGLTHLEFDPEKEPGDG